MTKIWWKAAGIRALKTVCQTAIAMIGTSAVLEDVNWLVVASASVLSGILSLLTSLAGLPEVEMAAERNDGSLVFDDAVEPGEDEPEEAPEEGVM